MNVPFYLGVILLLSIALASSDGNQATGSLLVSVSTYDGMTPKDVLVIVYDAEAKKPVRGDFYTNHKGQSLIENLVAGKYCVRIANGGRADSEELKKLPADQWARHLDGKELVLTHEKYAIKSGCYLERDVEIGNDGRINEVVFELKQCASIEGKVAYENGEGVRDSIVIRDTEQYGSSFMAFDGGNTYKLIGLNPSITGKVKLSLYQIVRKRSDDGKIQGLFQIRRIIQDVTIEAGKTTKHDVSVRKIDFNRVSVKGNITVVGIPYVPENNERLKKLGVNQFTYVDTTIRIIKDEYTYETDKSPNGSFSFYDIPKGKCKLILRLKDCLKEVEIDVQDKVTRVVDIDLTLQPTADFKVIER